jgi:hypothetical protein
MSSVVLPSPLGSRLDYDDEAAIAGDDAFDDDDDSELFSAGIVGRGVAGVRDVGRGNTANAARRALFQNDDSFNADADEPPVPIEAEQPQRPPTTTSMRIVNNLMTFFNTTWSLAAVPFISG